MTRSAAELDILMRRLGSDLALLYRGEPGLYEDADLDSRVSPGRSSRHRDLGVVSGVAAATQMLVTRLKTRRGELAPLGHPDYGSTHHELIGEPNTQRTRNLIKLRVLQALAQEPRIQEILSCRVNAPHSPPREIVRIEMTIRLIDEPNPLNLVVPFALEPVP